MLPRRSLLALPLLALPARADAAASVRPPLPAAGQAVEPVRGGFRFGRSWGRRRSVPHFTRDYRYRQRSNRY